MGFGFRQRPSLQRPSGYCTSPVVVIFLRVVVVDVVRVAVVLVLVGLLCVCVRVYMGVNLCGCA